MKEFTFKYQNSKGGLYVLLSFFIIPLVVILLSITLMNDVPWNFWITIPLGIGAVIYCMMRFIKISSDFDIITTDEDGFTSKSYGRVRYEDISSIPLLNILQAPPPSMKIKLKNRKKLIWQFNPQNRKSAEDVAAFIEFRNELIKNLELKAQELSKVNGEIDGLSHNLVVQLQRSKRRDYRYFVIPLSGLAGILIFVRTCGTDFIENKRKTEAREFTNAMFQMESDYEKNRQQAEKVATDYSLKFGPVSLFTNDPQAVIEFAPEIGGDPYASKINIFGIRRVEDNKILEEYIKHPDSVAYQMAIINKPMKFFSVMSKSIFREDRANTVPVYLTIYNPHESLPQSGFRGSKDTLFRPIEFNTSIDLPLKGEINKDILNTMDYASTRSVLQKYKRTFFYIAAKEQDGISAERFQQLKEMVIADFQKYGIPTDQFQERRFNVSDSH
ncbi:hypothetical protein C1637_23880 [Chryseobacterium lactis]|uniref:Uncharacterized protein n=1 Tax=Chryseobacterium lactis TaxID=1241981 RepID=A0A3G6RQE2_CHRLC|nr:hypothetical protein [Chryseobacterium lactis]AZA83285.1 hypothetical protein EG342_15990 [Chryseobacterium lactis]AZB03670.1 hypothetical protein EG341_06860 [Chryseobacterium lactis]PNW11121.1 hypothetical protein C1637_23880 [Chryseobacterium lactis]